MNECKLHLCCPSHTNISIVYLRASLDKTCRINVLLICNNMRRMSIRRENVSPLIRRSVILSQFTAVSVKQHTTYRQCIQRLPLRDGFKKITKFAYYILCILQLKTKNCRYLFRTIGVVEFYQSK